MPEKLKLRYDVDGLTHMKKNAKFILHSIIFFYLPTSVKIQETRYKKLYFPSFIVQQITRAISRHNRCKN